MRQHIEGLAPAQAWKVAADGEMGLNPGLSQLGGEGGELIEGVLEDDREANRAGSVRLCRGQHVGSISGRVWVQGDVVALLFHDGSHRAQPQVSLIFVAYQQRIHWLLLPHAHLSPLQGQRGWCLDIGISPAVLSLASHDFTDPGHLLDLLLHYADLELNSRLIPHLRTHRVLRST
ncbi:MAG: hypothetical protein PVI09_06165 [Anaerolineae bacterium]|jgi:hypothetical protein